MSKNSKIFLKIIKFGGTSVADFISMNKSADIVLSNNHLPMCLIVLSASAGVTNLLISLIHSKKKDHQIYYLRKIRQIQYNIISYLNNQEKIRKEIDFMIKNLSILSKSNNLPIPLELIDELISYGELMSTILFTEVLRQRGIYAKWFDIRQIMQTNKQFGRAKPNRKILKRKAHEFLLPQLRKKIIVTQGFIGRESNGKTTTLGRGGSDYTATLLGEALQAKQIDIWTDVSGIYITDPNVVPQAKRIKKISFKTAIEISSTGAKILHPNTFLPVVKNSIPIFIGSSKEPDAGGTLIYNYKKKEKVPIRMLSFKKNQILVKLNKLHTKKKFHFSFIKNFNSFSKYVFPIKLITISQEKMIFLLDDTNYHTYNTNYMIKKVKKKFSSFCQITIKYQLSLISLIGYNLIQINQIINKTVTVLKSFKIEVLYTYINSCNIFLVIYSKDSKKTIRILYSFFFEKNCDGWYI